MNCCSNCINDAFLATVIERESGLNGKCDFCNSEDMSLVDPVFLNDYFQQVLDLYEKSDDGKNIAYLLKNDWILFDSINIEVSNKLLEAIFDTNFDDKYISKQNDETKILNWQEFKAELKHDNRYFPTKAPSYEHLKGLLQFIILQGEAIPVFLYRSRVNEDALPIDINEMGKPPKKISTAGRANPVGIPYLYTASNIKTAIAEIRPHKGDSITVAKFKRTEPLILADLRNPRQSISPFNLDENALNQVFIDLEYLCHLGEELSKPILPRDAHLEYLSSQYLCELIKHCGFDGVIYKSSVGDGDNYAIFSDKKLKAIESDIYIVDNVEITSSKAED